MAIYADNVVVEIYNGSAMTFWKVDRRQMGVYLCIASNDVPPAVSKRVSFNVNCEFYNNSLQFTTPVSLTNIIEIVKCKVHKRVR